MSKRLEKEREPHRSQEGEGLRHPRLKIQINFKGCATHDIFEIESAVVECAAIRDLIRQGGDDAEADHSSLGGSHN